ncbi:hypothetical protein GQ44DRAFT_401322 [Phaeosphaeriaceae sp. PMI808]|nr:hypothetical protein GQ44DRAFT_401322 [Phaeosphaeriaceae sp. PMI808]
MKPTLPFLLSLSVSYVSASLPYSIPDIEHDHHQIQPRHIPPRPFPFPFPHLPPGHRRPTGTASGRPKPSTYPTGHHPMQSGLYPTASRTSAAPHSTASLGTAIYNHMPSPPPLMNRDVDVATPLISSSIITHTLIPPVILVTVTPSSGTPFLSTKTLTASQHPSSSSSPPPPPGGDQADAKVVRARWHA